MEIRIIFPEPKWEVGRAPFFGSHPPARRSELSANRGVDKKRRESAHQIQKFMASLSYKYGILEATKAICCLYELFGLFSPSFFS